MRKKIYTTGFITLALAGASCNLVDVTDIDPINQLAEDQAITTVNKAQAALTGTYSVLKTGLELVVYYPGSACLMGGTMDLGGSGGNAESQFRDHEIDPQNYTVDAIYTKWYAVISNANHIIEKAPLIETPNPRRDEIIGEARFLRALAHFYLLRFYGQFFDLNSKYGVVIKDKPIREAKSEPRSTVQQTYDFILADLDYAIAKGPTFTQTIYASRQAAKALKAKVLLYMKKFPEAATLAQEVITEGPFSLEATFYDVFFKKIFGTKEAIFQTPYDDKNDRNNKAFMFRSTYLPSEEYKLQLEGDKRDTAATTRTSAGQLRNKKFNNTLYPFSSPPTTLTADTEHFLRLAEIYLIRAEAVVRSNGNLEDARDALNEIRNRAVMPEYTSNDPAELLELIRKEKILELGAESGEEWFDLIRYATNGNLNINTIKPTITSVNQYILPLPFNTVKLSDSIVVQNPGY
ncbi:RagB/SusD family nutrient uptake outer membrane protein [Pseudoflavitalea rhizosphaerae]|uniref:RagB/SusD family nutrient uptake outer membrane protein n=1 Tax=Pseudoflavitalea rhizosphaerae TaxID=1884793 RepID=UPI000F8DF39F|nr:RagB/SusD family nutrient uptake outer membrane protein [Pseudoflavitalea rhizosphaerae]